MTCKAATLFHAPREITTLPPENKVHEDASFGNPGLSMMAPYTVPRCRKGSVQGAYTEPQQENARPDGGCGCVHCGRGGNAFPARPRVLPLRGGGSSGKRQARVPA